MYNVGCENKYAEMSEWSNEHDWKSCDVKASEGSNPSLCAKNTAYCMACDIV